MISFILNVMVSNFLYCFFYLLSPPQKFSSSPSWVFVRFYICCNPDKALNPSYMATYVDPWRAHYTYIQLRKPSITNFFYGAEIPSENQAAEVSTPTLGVQLRPMFVLYLRQKSTLKGKKEKNLLSYRLSYCEYWVCTIVPYTDLAGYPVSGRKGEVKKEKKCSITG